MITVSGWASIRSLSAQLISFDIGWGLSICARSDPKAVARASALGPLVGVIVRLGGTMAAITAAAPFSGAALATSAASARVRVSAAS